MPLTLLLFVIAIAALFLFYQKQQISAQKREVEAINQELQKRLLRAQINPHFIFNSLSSIQHFITNNDKRSALKYLSKFSNLLRQTLEQSTHQQVVLADEIKLLNNYLDLEALRFDHGFFYSVDADPDVDIHNTEAPILLVQPYIENAILHGLAPKKGEGRLSVIFSDEEAYTVCTIRDNGIGRKAAEALNAQRHPGRPSLGMAITEKRLALLYSETGAYRPVQVNDLVDESGNAAGTEVIVHIPKSIK